jgi:hypothetical protein
VRGRDGDVLGRAFPALLSDLVERGLDPEQGILFVIDGAISATTLVRSPRSIPSIIITANRTSSTRRLISSLS